jgi:hypothetical protein
LPIATIGQHHKTDEQWEMPTICQDGWPECERPSATNHSHPTAYLIRKGHFSQGTIAESVLNIS